MGISDWHAKRHMKHPERGVLRVSGFHHGHSSSSGRITGVITAPGIPDTPVEHKVDDHGRWTGIQEVPVLVDRADPAKFVILWDEVQPASWGDQMQPFSGDAGGMSSGPGVRVTSTTTFVTTGPDGQRAITPEIAAKMQAAAKVFGKLGGKDLSQIISQALDMASGQPSGRPAGQPFGQPDVPGYVQGGGQAFGPGDPQAFQQAGGQVDPQAFQQPGVQAFGQVDPQAFHQPGGHAFGQVDPQAFHQPGGQQEEQES
ncbi:MAG: hypothetical protein ABSA53_04850 [Streptosporangiaceae bacterium]|jgi:hypothetical protein